MLVTQSSFVVITTIKLIIKFKKSTVSMKELGENMIEVNLESDEKEEKNFIIPQSCDLSCN